MFCNISPLCASFLLSIVITAASTGNGECTAVSQITNTVLMVPPTNHTAVWDPETSADNSFMNQIEIDFQTLLTEWSGVVDALRTNGITVITADHDDISRSLNTPNCLFPNNWFSTHTEWSGVVDALRTNGITVITADHDDISRSLNTPNCLFPNNWFSTHDDTLTLYPMKAPNRRLEIRADIIKSLNYATVHDMTPHLEDDLYLEGTGALVLDRQHKIAYMSLSERASPQLAAQWAKRFKYQLILFESVVDVNTIYHTNVMMSVGSSYVIICIECIKGNRMRQAIKDIIVFESNKEVIEITQLQVTQFCGNVLEVGGVDDRMLVMSSTAYNNFSAEQRVRLTEQHGLKLVHAPAGNIETLLGGGVRCMIAELFTPATCLNVDNVM
eukprot:CAMPEP_0197072638 /NCGR_PEP_ID=MMETSP1384-20130603/210199_1 /TAXON_ID=29189 /ORGANISM="Ammonia sp." /LENGTH=385 /DNA_ID=CAMNT_0042511459 /DNA_START=165 /DNA_END=1322 /DNA_ORIENTATION=-